jgi:hypothetical protein
MAVPAVARAEWQITPLIGVTLHGNTTVPDLEHATHLSHTEFGGAVTFLTRGLLGAEGIFSVTPGFFHADNPKNPDGSPILVHFVKSSYTMALMGNAVIAAPRNQRTEYGFRPVVSGGLGLLRYSVTDIAALTGTGSNLLGFNVGGGVIGFITARTGVRIDFRYYGNLHKSAQDSPLFGPLHLRYMVLSVGVAIRTGPVH